MRRTLSTLLAVLPVLALVAGAALLAGCSTGTSQCPTMCQPSGTYEYVVDECCFPIDRNGNPLYGPRP